jgi:hypothetical protein
MDVVGFYYLLASGVKAMIMEASTFVATLV